MADIRTENDVLVGIANGRELRADVFRPESVEGPLPGILLLPGGGWQRCVRASMVERYGNRMAQRGFVSVVGEYRVMDEAPWPAQIQDVKAAIRWMRANSEELGIDPSRIIVEGNSAGGHLALLAAGSSGVAEFEGDAGNAGVSSDVASVIAIYPVTDMHERVTRPGIEKMFGPSPSSEVINGATPLNCVGPEYPPTMLVHGTADNSVPHSMSMRMYEALEKAGVPVDLHLYAGQDHIFDPNPIFAEPIADSMALFISRYAPARVGAGAA